jgi:hypothetical protein
VVEFGFLKSHLMQQCLFLLGVEFNLARHEIHYRLGNLWDWAWWKFVPGTVIDVKWPSGWVVLHTMPDGSKTSVESSDPNDHYRPWIEQHVGKQRWDWNWRVSRASTGQFDYDTVQIKVRKKKEKFASMMLLLWN